VFAKLHELFLPVMSQALQIHHQDVASVLVAGKLKKPVQQQSLP
jgi:hypothetical protein